MILGRSSSSLFKQNEAFELQPAMISLFSHINLIIFSIKYISSLDLGMNTSIMPVLGYCQCHAHSRAPSLMAMRVSVAIAIAAVVWFERCSWAIWLEPWQQLCDSITGRDLKPSLTTISAHCLLVPIHPKFWVLIFSVSLCSAVVMVIVVASR